MQNYNIILDTIDISEGSSVTEPVSLAEMKTYLRLQGFIDDNDSTAIPAFEDDDAIIEEMITAARQSLEEKLGCSIVEHTWQAIGVTNQAGNIQLKYGPVTAITAITDEKGDAYDHTDTDIVKLVGDFLKIPTDSNMTVNYTAGFTDLPKPIIVEIKRIVAWLYQHRGDEVDAEDYKCSAAVLKYSRRSWLE